MIWIVLALCLGAVAVWLHGFTWGKSVGKDKHFDRGYRAAQDDGFSDLWANQDKYEKLLFDYQRLQEQVSERQAKIRERTRPWSNESVLG